MMYKEVYTQTHLPIDINLCFISVSSNYFNTVLILHKINEMSEAPIITVNKVDICQIYFTKCHMTHDLVVLTQS